MKDDGGAVFPALGPNAAGTWFSSSPGLSLRDYFAAAALQGVARDYGVTAEDRARQCYEYADALIAQREKP